MVGTRKPASADHDVATPQPEDEQEEMNAQRHFSMLSSAQQAAKRTGVAAECREPEVAERRYYSRARRQVVGLA